MLTAHVRKLGSQSKPQYQGLIRCTDKNVGYIWQQTLNIVRLNRADALADALNEIEYIESQSAVAER